MLPLHTLFSLLSLLLLASLHLGGHVLRGPRPKQHRNPARAQSARRHRALREYSVVGT